MAEYRSVQAKMEKLWTERMGKEDKIMLNKYETLSSTVERLGNEIINLREREKILKRGEYLGRLFWELRERGSCHFECVHADPSGIERLGCLAAHSRNRNFDG